MNDKTKLLRLAKEVHEACLKRGVQYCPSMPEVTIMELLGRMDEMGHTMHRRMQEEEAVIKFTAVMETLKALNPPPAGSWR